MQMAVSNTSTLNDFLSKVDVSKIKKFMVKAKGYNEVAKRNIEMMNPENIEDVYFCEDGNQRMFIHNHHFKKIDKSNVKIHQTTLERAKAIVSDCMKQNLEIWDFKVYIEL